MKRIVCILITILFIIAGAFGLYKLRFKDNIEPIESNLNDSLLYKGAKGAVALAFDDKNDYYIATPNEVIKGDEKGNSQSVFKNNELSICSLTWNKNKLYFVSDTRLISYDLSTKEEKIIMDNIPNYGDYKNSKICIKDRNLFLTIGAATNSGVVGDDNKWRKKNATYDLTPKPISLSGKNFGENNNGPFVPYGTKANKGQVVPANFPGNASIIKINLDSNKQELYAWGIRNVEGIDFSSKGNVYAVVGGMEERGFRPVVGDKDYIYEIKGNGQWYGWPDYSGGDPVDSPRFRQEGKNKTYLSLDNHPTTNPPAPIYQHMYLSTLRGISIDKEGALMEKDSMFTYDREEEQMLNISSGGIIARVVKFNKGANVVDLKINNGKLYALEGKSGCLYSVYKNTDIKKINFSKQNSLYLLGVIVILIVSLVYKLYRVREDKVR